MKHRTIIIHSLLLSIAALLASCADQYKVVGATSVQDMEGKMLYLKVYASGDLRNIDSCRVQHGKFEFRGLLDSVVMANLFVGEQSVLPVVIEEGEVTMDIAETQQTVIGTPLNDSLNNFIRRKSLVDSKLAELPRKEGRMVMDGMDHEEVLAILSEEEHRLSVEHDELVTQFIKRNLDNVLGAGVFMIMTSSLPYPILTPQIEELLTMGTPYFLNHPYVKAYAEAARQNMEQLQGQ